jgi:hypothetical protein
MLLALLYQDDGELVAAAPACDQQPLGDRYWREGYPEVLTLRGSETAYVKIDDPELVDRLLRMDFHDGVEAARAVDIYLGLAPAPGPRWLPTRFGVRLSKGWRKTAP